MAVSQIIRFFSLRGKQGKLRFIGRWFLGFNLCLRGLIRVASYHLQILLFLQVINRCSVILKAVAFHRTVHIGLRCSLGFAQCLIFPLFIKAVFKMVVYYHLIPGRHTLAVFGAYIGKRRSRGAIILCFFPI